MNKKILAILLSVTMLISCLTIFAQAAQFDVEIDLSTLFGPTTGDNTNNGSQQNPTNPSSPTIRDDDDDDDSSSESKDIFSSDDKNEENKEWSNPFSDVKESDWFYATVKYASENGIMNGVGESAFAPSQTLTRAMLVTILYRVEGSPRLASDSKFSDVSISDWYGAPVIWANENGIVNGVSDTEFAPNAAISREQIAAIMFRYAKAKGFDVSVGESTNILSYDDYSAISSYAVEAIQYTAGSGLMKGKTATTINPKDMATRAEAATVVMRFIEGNK